jgi:hypothetical protein
VKWSAVSIGSCKGRVGTIGVKGTSNNIRIQVKTTNINATALKIALHNYLALDSKFVKIVVLVLNMLLKGAASGIKKDQSSV